MKAKLLLSLACCMVTIGLGSYPVDGNRSASQSTQLTGHLMDDRLTECSGMDTSMTSNFFWALNDSGDGPFLYALGFDGRSLGRVRVNGAGNRDWEDLATFFWRDRPMILVADIGDNGERQDTHTLYIMAEPRLDKGRFEDSASVDVERRIVFSYPDGGHDAEAVAVDAAEGRVLLLTKRDNPPLLFELPLNPDMDRHPLVARKVTAVKRIPQPSNEDLHHPFGRYSSQPTAMDFSPDGRQTVVLTYKHAYLFSRGPTDSWAAAFSRTPVTIFLPLPHANIDLRQREATCFAPDGMAFYVTSEGRGAGIYLFRTLRARAKITSHFQRPSISLSGVAKM